MVKIRELTWFAFAEQYTAWIILSMLYLLTRLVNLTSLPLLIDEGGYLWWGWRVLAGDFVRGFGQGKPLEGWLIAVPLGLGLDAVLAARIVHVLAGMLSWIAVCLLARRYLNTRVAWIAVVLYILAPYTLFFERLATPDVLLAACGIWTLYFAMRMIEGDRRAAIAAGVTTIIGILAKSPIGAYFLIVPLGALLSFSPPGHWKRYVRQAVLCYALPAIFVALAAAVVTYRWQSGLEPVGFGLHEVLSKTPSGRTVPILALASANLRVVLSWFGTYLTWPLAGVVGLSGVAALARGELLPRLLAVFSIPFVALFVLISTYFAPRYFCPVLSMIILLAAWAIDKGVERMARWVALSVQKDSKKVPWGTPTIIYGVIGAIFLILVLPFDTAIILHPEFAPLPAADRFQHIEGVPSGYGLRDAAAYLENEIARSGRRVQVVLPQMNDYGRLKAYAAPALRALLVQVHIVGGQNQDVPHQIALVRSMLTQADDTYLVASSSSLWSMAWREAFPQAVLVEAFPKPGGKDQVELYAVR